MNASTEQGPSWEAVSRVPGQETPSLLFNPKFHYSIRKNPPQNYTQTQFNPVHILTAYSCKLHYDHTVSCCWQKSI
jgi:hypothetical protein